MSAQVEVVSDELFLNGRMVRKGEVLSVDQFADLAEVEAQLAIGSVKLARIEVVTEGLSFNGSSFHAGDRFYPQQWCGDLTTLIAALDAGDVQHVA